MRDSMAAAGSRRADHVRSATASAAAFADRMVAVGWQRSGARANVARTNVAANGRTDGWMVDEPPSACNTILHRQINERDLGLRL